MTSNPTIGAWFKTVAKRRQLSAYRIAKAAELASPSTITRIYRGESAHSGTLWNVLRVLKPTPEEWAGLREVVLSKGKVLGAPDPGQGELFDPAQVASVRC